MRKNDKLLTDDECVERIMRDLGLTKEEAKRALKRAAQSGELICVEVDEETGKVLGRVPPEHWGPKDN